MTREELEEELRRVLILWEDGDTIGACYYLKQIATNIEDDVCYIDNLGVDTDE